MPGSVGNLPRVAETASPTTDPAVSGSARVEVSPRARLVRALSFRNISAIYVFIVLFIIFTLWVPDTFLTVSTWKTLLENGALTAMIATGLCVPIAAGCIDLAVGTEVGLGGILVAWMLADHGFAIVPAIALALLAGALIGLANGLLVIKGRMDSFIATMGMSSVLTAMIAWPSGGTQILNLKPSFESLGTNELFGVTYPVYILLVVAVVVWYILERTPAGRRVYATGGNIEAARLSGVPTSRVIVISLAVSATIAAAAGVLETSQLATGDPTVGPAYLIPAIAAVFLGSTQFRGGRVNVAGTIVAVYVLAVGVKGLQLAGAPVWLPDLFNGVALLIAVGLSRYERTAARSAAIKKVLPRLRRRREHESATPSQ